MYKADEDKANFNIYMWIFLAMYHCCCMHVQPPVSPSKAVLPLILLLHTQQIFLPVCSHGSAGFCFLLLNQSILCTFGIDRYIIQNDYSAHKHQNAFLLIVQPLQTQHIKWVTTALVLVAQLQCDFFSFSLPLNVNK